MADGLVRGLIHIIGSEIPGVRISLLLALSYSKIGLAAVEDIFVGPEADILGDEDVTGTAVDFQLQVLVSYTAFTRPRRSGHFHIIIAEVSFFCDCKPRIACSLAVRMTGIALEKNGLTIKNRHIVVGGIHALTVVI